MESWPHNKKEEFIHKMKKFRNYLDRKEVDLKTLSDMSITVNIMSSIIEFLLIKTRARHIIWISDRDRITDFQDGIVNEFVRIGYASLVNKRVSDNEVYGFWGGKEYDKQTFDELIRISGLSHGTDVWLGNAQTLIEQGVVTLQEAICCRDDIMIYLIKKGLPPDKAFKIMETVRKGKALKDPEKWEGFKNIMKEHDVPDWYIKSCEKIKNKRRKKGCIERFFGKDKKDG